MAPRNKSWPTGGKDVLDVLALQRLADETSPDLMPQLLATFVDELADQTKIVASALRKEDLGVLERESHIIISSAALFGTPRLQAAAELTNATCRAGDSQRALELGAVLLTEIATSSQSLNKYCGRNPENLTGPLKRSTDDEH